MDIISGIEIVVGSDFNDSITGDGLANVLIGGLGNDSLNGAGGRDTVSYLTATSGVTISLASGAPQDTQGAGVDTLTNIENIEGSNYADSLRGDGWENLILGNAGTIS